MADFNKDRKFGRRGSGGRDSRGSFGRSGSRGSFGDGRRESGGFGRRDSNRSEVEMHQVICDKCGESCEVPFKPTEGKPIYCNNCFKKPERAGSRGGSNNSKELEQINEKLDKIMLALKIE